MDQKEKDAVRAAACVHSPRIRGALLQCAKEEVEYEWKRMTSLNARASGLLVVVPLALAITTFAAASLNDPFSQFLAGLAVLAAVVTAGIAAKALTTEGYSRPNWKVLFDQEELSNANSVTARASSDEEVLAGYEQWLTPHYWEIARDNKALNTAKEGRVSAAQTAFAAFLFFLALTAAVLLLNGSVG